MIKNNCTRILLLSLGCWFSCHPGPSLVEGGDQAPEVKTPVTVGSIKRQSVTDDLLLNATASFMQKNVIGSNVNGYIQKSLVSPGQMVDSGQVLFVMQTKEAHAFQGNMPDSILSFSGFTRIRAAHRGYIIQLNHQQGDYVQDGEQLCILADKASFAFILDVPFALSPVVKTGHPCTVMLPDGTQTPGRVTMRIPSVDLVSQTQRYIVKINKGRSLPENLIAGIRITRSVHRDAVVLPKSALLTDEMQTEWWVMQLINDSTAVKVPVKKGGTAGDMVEIISPSFIKTDRILTSGNYGLGDTALVQVEP